jgi:sulfite reductase beta subunit-like hemoprotein
MKQKPAVALGALRPAARTLARGAAPGPVSPSSNIGLLTDMIACPGGDFCAPGQRPLDCRIAQALLARYQDLDELHDLGEIDLHISGCINSAAATTTAVTSASWASTKTARSGTRSRSAAPTATTPVG